MFFRGGVKTWVPWVDLVVVVELVVLVVVFSVVFFLRIKVYCSINMSVP